jgi:hypothetical protein
VKWFVMEMSLSGSEAVTGESCSNLNPFVNPSTR